MYAEDVPLAMLLKCKAGAAGAVLHPHRPREFIALSFEWGDTFYGMAVQVDSIKTCVESAHD